MGSKRLASDRSVDQNRVMRASVASAASCWSTSQPQEHGRHPNDVDAEIGIVDLVKDETLDEPERHSRGEGAHVEQ